MWKLLGGKKAPKRKDPSQEEKTSNHGPLGADGPQPTAPSRRNTQCQLRTNEDHQPPQARAAEEDPVVLAPPPQTSAEQQLEMNIERPEAAPGFSQPFDDFTTVSVDALEADDVVIAVMGPTGSGKSTFIRRASGHEDTLGVGHTLKSFTSDVHAFKFWDQASGQHVVLVDTPGFDDTFKSDLDILNIISDWLNSSYKKDKLLSGILYLHRITDNRMAGTPLKNLRVFRKLCGKDALNKVYLTTTMWDEVEPNIGEKRLAELTQEYWKAMVNQGAQIARCRNDDNSPMVLIQRILDQDNVRKAVQLQEEMTELNKELKETGAGQELFSQLEKLVEKQLVLLRRIGEERKKASDSTTMEELQLEYSELRQQIDERLRQMQELKLSWWKKNFRFLRK